MRRADKAGLLFDFAVSKPEGFTYADVRQEFGWPRSEFFRVVRRLRLDLGGDDITLPCEPNGFRGLWLYHLAGDYDSARAWATNRIGDMEARLETIHAVSSSVSKGTTRQSIEGRKARKIQSTVGYLLTELADMREDM